MPVIATKVIAGVTIAAATVAGGFAGDVHDTASMAADYAEIRIERAVDDLNLVDHGLHESNAAAYKYTGVDLAINPAYKK